MYSKQEAALLRQQFWTSLGQYLRPIPSADGEKINWINYKTGVRFIEFKMYADNLSASIAIEISHPIPATQKLYVDQFLSLEKILLKTLPGKWNWNTNAGSPSLKPLSSIFSTLPNVNVYNKEDWPAMISFFKTALLAIDSFWVGYRDVFEML